MSRLGWSFLFLVTLIAWTGAWVAVATSSAVALLSAWAWVLAILASAAPLELLYRRAVPRPVPGRHRGVYRDGCER